MIDIWTENALWVGVLIGALLILCFGAGRRALIRSRDRRQRRTRSSRAQKGEAAAEGLLVQAGFCILERQAPCHYTYSIEGEAVEVTLKPDLIVARDDNEWVVEVKTGHAADLKTIATRRQLLEYCHAFSTRDILLVDMVQKTISEISFPDPTDDPY